MYISRLLAVAALLLLGANSMPKPQADTPTPTEASAAVHGPPTGTSSGSSMGGGHLPGSWKEFEGEYHGHHGPPAGVGAPAAGESTVPSATPGENPTPADNSTSGAAATSVAAAAATTGASSKLRRAVLF